MKFQWLGQVGYQAGLKLQKQTVEQVRVQPDMAVVYGLEHSPVITLGRRSNASLDLLQTTEFYQKNGVEIAETDRGGEAVIHLPGQLVTYPSFSLKQYDLGVRDWVGLLERSAQDFLSAHGIASRKGEESGLWTERGKIAAFGIRVQHGITLHGMALNVCNDLNAFSWLRVCGHHENGDRMSDWGVTLSPEKAFGEWQGHLLRNLNSWREKKDISGSPSAHL